MTLSDAARKALEAAIADNSIAEHIDEYNGLCFACGSWKYGGCEPDACNWCDECDAFAVFGAVVSQHLSRWYIIRLLDYPVLFNKEVSYLNEKEEMARIARKGWEVVAGPFNSRTDQGDLETWKVEATT